MKNVYMFTQLRQWKHKHENNEINTKYTGADPKVGLTPPLPRRREREGRKNVPQEGSAPNPVDTILMYFFIFYNFGIRWGRKRSLDPSLIQDAPFQLNKTIYENTNIF